jgi:polysaccharide biosynthesis protein PslH
MRGGKPFPQCGSHYFRVTREKRILWISNHTPFLTDFGGGQRSKLIYRCLQSIGEIDVLLVCPPNNGVKSVRETHGEPEFEMQIVQPLNRGEYLPWRLLRVCAPSLVDKMAYNLGRRVVDYQRDCKVGAVFDGMMAKRGYDLIIGRHVKYPSKAGAFEHRPIIVDVDDNELDLYQRIIEDRNTSFLRRIVLKRRIKSLARIVPMVLARSDYLWVSKEEDRDIAGCERAEVLPNIPYGMSLPEPPAPLKPEKGSKVLLFVGMLSYIYNAPGIDLFLREGWPLIRTAEPDAVFRLVGSRLSQEDRNRWSSVPGVEVVGFVEDLRKVYQNCAFVVVPVWSGGGTNIKVLEALMYGRTCVISRPAHRGYSKTLRENESLRVGRNTPEMAAHCIELLKNPGLSWDLAERGAKIVRDVYSYSRFAKIVMDTAEHAMHGNAGLRLPS